MDEIDTGIFERVGKLIETETACNVDLTGIICAESEWWTNIAEPPLAFWLWVKS